MTDAEDPKVEALAEVAKAAGQHQQAIEGEEAARAAHHAAIVAALKAGAGPSAIERVSTYDRQHVDRIRRAAGLPATRKATVQGIKKEE